MASLDTEKGFIFRGAPDILIKKSIACVSSSSSDYDVLLPKATFKRL